MPSPVTPSISRAGQLPGRPVYDQKFDGWLVGRDGPVRGGAFDDVVGVRPAPGHARAKGRKAIFVNGVMDPLDQQQEEMVRLANATGFEIVGLHNATGGVVPDVQEAFADTVNQRANKLQDKNRATQALRPVILRELQAGRPVYIFAFSQGALIVSNALRQARAVLAAQGKTALLSRVTVETLAGGSAQYPDGPNYTHYINDVDPVQILAGTGWPTRLGKLLGSVSPHFADVFERHPGRNARIIHFSEFPLHSPYRGETLPAHSLSVYLRHRIDARVRARGARALRCPAATAHTAAVDGLALSGHDGVT